MGSSQTAFRADVGAVNLDSAALGFDGQRHFSKEGATLDWSHSPRNPSSSHAVRIANVINPQPVREGLADLFAFLSYLATVRNEQALASA